MRPVYGVESAEPCGKMNPARNEAMRTVRDRLDNMQGLRGHHADCGTESQSIAFNKMVMARVNSMEGVSSERSRRRVLKTCWASDETQ